MQASILLSLVTACKQVDFPRSIRLDPVPRS